MAARRCSGVIVESHDTIAAPWSMGMYPQLGHGLPGI
jgi:hypothetical protein